MTLVSRVNQTNALPMSIFRVFWPSQNLDRWEATIAFIPSVLLRSHERFCIETKAPFFAACSDSFNPFLSLCLPRGERSTLICYPGKEWSGGIRGSELTKWGRALESRDGWKGNADRAPLSCESAKVYIFKSGSVVKSQGDRLRSMVSLLWSRVRIRTNYH